MTVVNLYDLLSDEEKARVDKKFYERTARKNNDGQQAPIAPEVWIVGQFGNLFGFAGIEAI
jgi:hypothetical protein